MEYFGGRQVVLEALRSGHKLHRLFLGDSRILKEELGTLAAKAGLQGEACPAELQEKMEGSQGVLAYGESFSYSNPEAFLDAQSRKEEATVVVLDHLEDPHNLGAIIRTALCAGAAGIVIPDDRSVRVTQTVLKVSAGAAFHLPIVKVSNIPAFLKKMKDAGFWVYGGDMAGPSDLYETALSGRIAIVAGNEGKGISPIVKKSCDVLISIPQEGPLGSLNVSVATGLILYEAMRQRRYLHGRKQGS